MNSADADQKKQFEQLRSETDEEKKIAAVKALYEQTGARQKVLDKAESLYRSSLNKLQQVDLPETQKAVLFAMAEKVNSRDY